MERESNLKRLNNGRGIFQLVFAHYWIRHSQISKQMPCSFVATVRLLRGEKLHTPMAQRKGGKKNKEGKIGVVRRKEVMKKGEGGGEEERFRSVDQCLNITIGPWLLYGFFFWYEI